MRISVSLDKRKNVIILFSFTFLFFFFFWIFYTLQRYAGKLETDAGMIKIILQQRETLLT